MAAFTEEQYQKAAHAVAMAPAAVPLKQILSDAGFSKHVAEHPGKIVKSDRFQQLLEEYLPDTALLTRHAELLASDNEPVAAKMVELGYKVKRRLNAEDQRDLTLNIRFANAPTKAVIDGEVVDVSIKEIEPVGQES